MCPQKHRRSTLKRLFPMRGWGQPSVTDGFVQDSCNPRPIRRRFVSTFDKRHHRNSDHIRIVHRLSQSVIWHRYLLLGKRIASSLR